MDACLRSESDSRTALAKQWSEFPAADRMRLLEGLDDIGLTLKHTDEIVAWEKRTVAEQPWLQQARDNRPQ